MARLERSWISPGYYPLGNINELKWENTQEFHDSYIKLKNEVNQAVKQAEQQLADRNHAIAQGQLMLERPLYQWSDNDFESFMMFNMNPDEVKRKLKALIMRDKMAGLLQRLKQYQAVLRQESEEAMKGGDRARKLIDQLNDTTVFSASGYTGLNGWEQLRFISKNQFDSAKGTKTSVNVDAVVDIVVNASDDTDAGKGSDEPVRSKLHEKQEK